MQGGANTLNVVARNSAGYNSDPVVVNVTYLTPPIAIWHMDNNWQDSSGNGNHGTAYNGATFSASAKVGTHAGSFDGANDYVDIGDKAILRPANITVEAWVRINGSGTGSYPSIVATNNGGGAGGYLLRYNPSNGKFEFYIYRSVSWKIATTDSSVSQGAWHHIVGRYDGSEVSIWLDGVKQAATSAATGIDYFIGTKTSIGAYAPPTYSNYINGLIDDMTIYNRALSADEIKAHYDAASVPSPTVNPVTSPTTSQTITLSGTKSADTSIVINGVEAVPADRLTTWQVTYTLKSYVNTLNVIAKNAGGCQSEPVVINVTYSNAPIAIWHMDNNWQDSSGNGNNGMAYNGATFTTNSKIGTNAGSFDGANDYVEGSNSGTNFPIGNSTRTIEAWIKVADTAGADRNIFHYGTADGTPGSNIHLMVSNGGSLSFGNGYGFGMVGTSVIVDDNNWHHVVGVYEGPGTNMIRVYVDGVLRNFGTPSTMPNTGTGSKWRMGVFMAGGSTIPGLIDELAVYNRALTAQEIQEHYQASIVAQPTVNSVPSSTTSKQANTSILVNGTEIVPLDSSTTWQGTYTLQSSANTLSVIARNSAGYNSDPVVVNVTYLTPPIAIWHMDNNWFDSSGNGNHGTAYNGATFSASAKIGSHAGSFDGSNDYVQIPGTSSFNLSSDFTISFWLKKDASENGNFRVLMGKVSCAGGDGWYIRKGTAAQGSHIVFEMGNSSQQYRAYGSSSSTPAGSWQYYVFTRQGANWKVYIDGSLQGSGSNFESPYVNSYDLYIGRLGTCTAYNWYGLVDEVAVYNRALSASEILEHYQLVYIAPPTVNPVTSPIATQTITLSGTKPTNTSIIVNGTQVYQLDALITWQGTYTLQSGTNTLNITDMDDKANLSQPVTITVIYDNTAPTISSSIPSNNASINTPITSVTINLTDAYSAIDLAATTNVASVKNSLGQDIPGAWTTSGNSTVIFAPSNFLSEGTYTVTIYPTDSFGNKTTAQITFTYDATTPPSPFINAVVTPTNIASQVLSGTKSSDTTSIVITTSPASTVGAISYPTGTTWSITVSSIKEGTNTITAYAKDSAGNQSAGVSTTMIYDSIAPSAPTANVTSPTKDAVVTLTGTKEANSSILINGTNKVSIDSLTTWQGTFTLQSGSNILNITSKDAAGNQSGTTTVTVILDDKPPVIESSVPVNNSDTAKVVENITINLTDTYSPVNLDASIAGATVKNSSGQTIAGAWATSGTKTIIFTPSNPFPEDTYTVIIYPADILGNSGTQQIVFINHDITKPVTTIALSGTKDSAGWYSTAVTVTLTANDGNDGAGIEKTEYSLDNITWNLYSAPFVVNKDGISNVKYRSTDKAGNIETAKSQELKINLTGIVGWWKMDNNWLDSSVVGNNGTANGVTFSTNAKIGTRAGIFDGVDDYVEISANQSLDISNTHGLSVEFWFNMPDVNTARNITVKNSEIAICAGGDYLIFRDNKGDGLTQPISNLSPNTWYHFVGQYDYSANKVRIYLNGLMVGEGMEGTWNPTADTRAMSIGSGSYPNGGCSSTYYKGLLDEVIIYNRALSADEIKAHYDAAQVQPPTVNPVTSPTGSQTITLSGTKPANTSIRANGAEIAPLDALTTWQGTYTLQSGSNTLNITAMDTGSYQSLPAVITVIYDNIPPVISGSTPANNASLNTPVTSVSINLTDTYSTIDLTSTINGAIVKNSYGQDIPGAWTASGSNSALFTPTNPFGEGTYTLTIYPTDEFGNRASAQISFSYDILAPPAPAINAVVSPTNISAQVVSGTKSSDTSAITFVTSPALTIGTVSYPTTTSWSVLVSGLKDGENIITAYAKDLAGNQSTGVSASIVYDFTAPAAPVINALTSPTKNTSVTLTGTKEANTYLYVNGTKTPVMFIDTAWGYTVSLNEGANTVTVYAKDGAGNQSTSASAGVTRDTTPPMISSATPSGNSFINQAGNVDILLADSYSSVDLTASITGATVKDPSGSIVSGSWSISGAHIIFTPQAVMAANGAYTVTIYPADSLGNTGTASFSFTMDTTPPQVQSLAMNPASPHKAETVTFVFTFNEDVLTNVVPTVTFGVTPPYNTYQMSGSWTNSKTWQGTYTFTNAIGDGTYTLNVSGAKDKAGNVMTASEAGSFVLDTGTPVKPVIDPITTPTKTAAITISGTKPANTGITINGTQKVSLDSLTTWSCAYTLTEGANNLSVRVMNAAGNESLPVIAAVVLDTVVPRISVSSPSNGSSMNLVTKIDILLIDDTTSVDLSNSLAGASVKLAGQSVAGAWSIENSHLIFTPSSQFAAGTYYVTIYPVDILGNKATINISFTVDLTPSLVQSLTMTPASPHKAEAVTFAVTFNEDMTTTQQPTVTFTRGTSYPTYTITGSWTNAKTWSGSYTFTSGTGDGTYTVSVSGAKDKAGNAMNPQDAGTFILDTILPSSPTISLVTTPTKTPNQIISGTKPADTAIVINNIERVSLSSSASWSYTYPLSEGSNNISVSTRDAAGNDSAPVTTAITLDTTPPAFNINTYKNPSPTLAQALTGTKEAGCIVKLNGVTIFDSADQNAAWSHTVSLTEGLTSHFVFTASDALGNTTTKAIDILYDASAPGQLGPGVLVADGSGKGTEITLSWAAYVETPDIAYYRIFMSTANFTDTTGMAPTGTTNKGIKTFKVTGLTQESTYYFAVVPIDISGNFTPFVNTAVGIPKDTAPPEDVSITSVTAGSDIVSGNFITLKWNPSVNSKGDLADQVVYFDDGKGYDSGTALGKIVTTYTKTGLNDAAKYKFKITVKDTLAHESNGVIAEGVTRLPNPETLSANPGNARITLSWSAVSSPYVKQYNIYRIISDVQQKDVKTMLLIKTVSSSTYTYTDTGLTNNTDYQYAVTTLNTFGAERTDVLSITARPRMDNTGPVIGSFNITQGQVITAPITISASATDAESTVGKIELYIDGVLVKTQTGSSISYFWNVVDTTDGNHTIKLIAYDQYGNVTEAERQVVVSLAPPSVPAITGHTIAGTTPKYLVNVTGTASLYTTVILRVNGVVVTQMPASSTGTFLFASVELKEGDNFLAVKASHRGGESQYSVDYKIVVDTGAPLSPVNLTSQVLTGGAVRLSWQNAAGEIPSGYNLYMRTSSFVSKTDAGVTKTNTTPILYLLNDYTPPSDSLRYYAVTSVDSAGNESGISNVVSASSDRVAPYVSSIKYRYTDPTGIETYPATIAGPGSVKAELTVNEALKELPFLSLEPTSGSPIIISLLPALDKEGQGVIGQGTQFEGTFSVTALIESGTTTYKFSGKDMTGNRGTAQGAGIIIDASGPVAAIQSPLTLLQIKPEPVTVNVTFNEPSVTVPVMELRSLSGLTAAITGLYTTDNGVHWTGTVDISALPEGNAEFKLIMAKDKLGNTGTTVSSGKAILIYRDSVPSPDTPAGLTTKTGKAGVITLTWNPIGNASSYNLYRRAEGETTPVKIKTGILGSPSQDTPPSDGIYYYSVTSVGLLNSESPRSAEVQGVSDRTGPPAPINLALMLDSTGVVATWNIQAGETPWAYALYRSNSPITTSSGLTPLIKVGITKAVDVSPSRTYRFYAVAAHDILGNEGPLSETKEINFPVSPVRDLVLEKIDDAAPRITWVAPYDGDTIGYHIYRNSQRITSYPVTVLSFTDGYYSRGNVTYGVSAVNNLGVEGPIKEVTLPELSIGIKQGTILRRGLLETIPIILSLPYTLNATPYTLSVDTIGIKVGTAPSSIMQGPFTLTANSTLQVEKVAATTADAPSFVSVLATASWSPTPGATVRITKTSSAEVTGSSTALEIYSDPLIRGTDGKIRLKVNNIGTALMEFLTSENSGVTTKVKVTLKDEDGNVLSTGYLDQRVGNAILNTGTYAVARLNPNENMITDPITINVPQSAPYKVIIEAKIENTFYHYGKSDQVVAPGMTQSIETTISETAYRAYASPEKTFYPYAQPVLITGQAINNTSNQPMPYVPVKLGISIKGFDRFFTVTTDATGNFAYTFTPGSNEAGLYTIWAVHPDIKDRAVQATFAIAGLSMSPETATVRMARNRTIDIPVSLYNYGGASLTGLTLETQAGTGITAGIINNGDTVLYPGENQNITLRITSSSSSPDNSWASMKATLAEGFQKTLNASISMVQLIPVITTNPSYIDTGMVRGNQKIATFNISNVGEEVLRNARIEGPSTSWMSLTVNRAIGDMSPGTSKTIGIMFNPPSTLAQGVYDDRVVIYSDNHIAYTYHIQVTVTSNAVGNVMFDVLNELMQDVSNASITLQHQTLTELIYSLRTAADGTVMLYDIPEGRYSFNISATGHKSYSGTFVISPGITTTVPVALEVTLVQVEWSVTPIVIQDRYEIVVTQTFQTNVPTPVLVIEPASITVPELAPGQVFNGEFAVANYGLIALNDVNIQFPTSFGEYNIELLATVPKTLNAMQKITVPYRITRRLTTASYQPSAIGSQYAFNSESCNPQTALFEEVMGYGGTPCYNSFTITASGNAIICPNTAQAKTVTKTAGYTVIIPIPGSNCSISGGGAPVGGVIGGGGSYGGGTGSQTGGGVVAPSSGTPITPIASETCISPGSCGGQCCDGSTGGGGGSGGPEGCPGGICTLQ
ncbi:MAG: fibronectin type III domain-containing protein [Nitrospirae bacterium]|nr:MAG: fibronectin type III domain-containing protein [Nitrospirota bacterium]